MSRVLLVSETSKRGGAERALASLARHLPAAGWRPTTALLERGPLEEWLEGTDVRLIEPGVDAAERIAALADDHEVVVANKWRAQLVAGPAARRSGLPCLWWQQDFPGSSPRQLLESRSADAVVCSSDAVAEEQLRAAAWSRPIRVPLGVDADGVQAWRGTGEGLRRELGIGSGPVVGMVGRLAPDKRQDLFLRAALRIAALRPETRFLIVGGEILGTERDYAEAIRALPTGLGLGDRVIFTGHRPDPYSCIDALDVLIHPAEREPFGLVLLEAMALGVPVVAIDRAGPSEIVQHGRSGLLVEPGQAGELATAGLRAMADPALPSGGLDRVREFTEPATARAFARVLEVLARSGRKAAARERSGPR